MSGANRTSLDRGEVGCAFMGALGIHREGLLEQEGARLVLEETTADAGESLVDLEEVFPDPGETFL